MRDITTNSSESQNKNQKTTPVIESFFEPNDSSISLPGVVLQIWLGMRDSNPRSRDQNPVPYHLANPQYVVLCRLRTMCARVSGPERDSCYVSRLPVSDSRCLTTWPIPTGLRRGVCASTLQIVPFLHS